ncbi:transposase [Bdellovibrio sp. SKB1291214]|uniref:transposase n=1 Tax=Bdellovibrio sp. SKB1291214 TaxID=1732569 RepID=UPI001C3E701E|nr:transposase [Bdellovibrio sp. SKB1291214]UYL10696.1 transposase [Bdellovibrio sp. SKB1291214]
MARKKILYTNEHPYHVMARSNNKDWFYLPISTCWDIFSHTLKDTTYKYGLGVYAFVLMNNHYHLICQCSDNANLGEAMNYFQKTTSKIINSRAQRINHVFGGPYKGSLIRDPQQFSLIYKYVIRNPITAGICSKAEEYPYSTFTAKSIALLKENEWFAEMPENRFDWLNMSFEAERYLAINRALKRTEFKIAERLRRT